MEFRSSTLVPITTRYCGGDEDSTKISKYQACDYDLVVIHQFSPLSEWNTTEFPHDFNTTVALGSDSWGRCSASVVGQVLMRARRSADQDVCQS